MLEASIRYGFIGLGNLGRHVAGSLVRAGFPAVLEP
jgi:3-hydroxyisobutyrate dehydrogenase-like beta-hydroxyacid dehydrogenase